jgi:hypothetical protein
MKNKTIITTITAALMAVGIVSQVSASGSFGTTNVVYITGSTAFRGNVFNAVTNNANNTTSVFDHSNSVVTFPANASSSTSQYYAYGTIRGTPYLLDFDFTGSEAGLSSLNNVTVLNPVKNAALNYTNALAALPGSPYPTFYDPSVNTATITNVIPDLSFADTSQAVSLTAPPTYTALTDYGIVAVIPFTWAKGKNSSPDPSWNSLSNVTKYQLYYALANVEPASYFEGILTNTDNVYLVGRNKGSGTRVNTLIDADYGIKTSVSQWAANSTYNAAGVLTFGSAAPITGVGSLAAVGNDGFDAGSGVAGVLESDTKNSGLITLGYVGISDANNAKASNAVWLTLDGQAENDATVINGTYSFWGHEHLYGVPSQSPSSPGGFVGQDFAGTTVNESLQGWTSNGALEAFGLIGGTEANTAGTSSTAIDPAVMNADKPSDSGYPSPFN